jgi:hypothetical protein
MNAFLLQRYISSADYLRFITKAQLFWFTLNTSYDHGCHLASRFCLEPEDYKVVSPLVTPPSSSLVVPAGCRITSCCPLIASPSRRLVAPAGCRIASRHPLVAPPSRPIVVPACFTSTLLVLLLCCPLVLSSCRLVVVLPLLAPPSRPFVVPAIFTSPSHCRCPSPTPWNTIECCLHHQTPSPPPPLNAVSIVH